MKFSIITVCYNSAKTIRRTFESVLNQNFTDYEYIVVDGASKDNTLDIIKEYEPKFNGRMRYVSEPDKGIYDAMNKGIRMAQGEIIGIINSDDYYETDALYNLLPYLNTPADVYYGMMRCVDEKSEIHVCRHHHSQLHRQGLAHPACFVRKDTYLKFGDFNLEYPVAADYELMLRFWLNKAVFCPVEKILTVFFVGGISSTVTLNEFRKIQLRYGLISQKQYIKYWLYEKIRKCFLKWR